MSTMKEIRARAATRRQIIVAGYRARKTLNQIAYEAQCNPSWVSMVARTAGCEPRHAQALSGLPLCQRVKGYQRKNYHR